MNSFVVVLCALVACASAGHVGLWGGHGWNPAAHVASGSVSVGANGAVLAGPAGSVATDNGLGGHGAGARLSGPAGDVRTHGGAVSLAGPGLGGHGGLGWGGVGVVGPVGIGLGGWGHGVGVWGGHGGWGHGGWGHGAWGHGW